jgi:hypothetical protein
LVSVFEAPFVSDFPAPLLAPDFPAPLLAPDFPAPFLALVFAAPFLALVFVELCFDVFDPSVFVEIFFPLEAPFWAALPSFFPPVDDLGAFSFGI